MSEGAMFGPIDTALFFGTAKGAASFPFFHRNKLPAKRTSISAHGCAPFGDGHAYRKSAGFSAEKSALFFAPDY